MAKISQRVSDLSGAVDAEAYTLNVTLKLDRVNLDVTTDEATDLDARVKEFTDAVHALFGETFGDVLDKVAATSAAGATTTGGAATRVATGKADGSAVRAWARENRIPVSDRGRFSAELLQAYADATRAAGKVTDLDVPVEQDGPSDADLEAIDAEATA